MVNSKRFLLFEWIWKALISTLQKEIEEHYSLIPRDQKFHNVVNVFPTGHATLHLSYITAIISPCGSGDGHTSTKHSNLKRNRTRNIYKYTLAVHGRLWKNWATFINHKTWHTLTAIRNHRSKAIAGLEQPAFKNETAQPQPYTKNLDNTQTHNAYMALTILRKHRTKVTVDLEHQTLNYATAEPQHMTKNCTLHKDTINTLYLRY